MTDIIKQYIQDIKHIPLLSPEEELEIALKIKKGNKAARAKMIRSNLRLVINIAKRYSYLGVPIMDLIEEGNIGLMKAVEKYNPKKGFRFSTYAAWWIRQYITRAIANQGKTVRVPVYMVELAMRFKKVNEQLSHQLKRRPRMAEIAKSMKISLKRLKLINKMVTKISSLNAPVGEEGSNAQFIDLIGDDMLFAEDKQIVDFLQEERIKELLKKLLPRERKILALRFGLKDGVTFTLSDAAKKFGITRERVRQIEEVALKKLRTMIKKQELGTKA